MINFKLWSFWIGKPLQSISVTGDTSLAEVLDANGFSINSHVDMAGKQLDVGMTVEELGADGKFLIVKWEVKTSWALTKNELEAVVLELKEKISQYEEAEPESEYVIIPQPEIVYPDGQWPEYPAVRGQQIMEWVGQFAQHAEISRIEDANWNEVSPFAKIVEGTQYRIIMA